jgi:hypothetical protein
MLADGAVVRMLALASMLFCICSLVPWLIAAMALCHTPGMQEAVGGLFELLLVLLSCPALNGMLACAPASPAAAVRGTVVGPGAESAERCAANWSASRLPAATDACWHSCCCS